MFNLVQAAYPIISHYMGILGLNEISIQFALEWLKLLAEYCVVRKDRFVRFEPELPLLGELVPDAVALLIYSPYTPHLEPPRVSWIRLELFGVRLREPDTTVVCLEAERFIELYLRYTGIRIVGMFNLWKAQENALIERLQRKFPGLIIYRSAAFRQFVQDMEESR